MIRLSRCILLLLTLGALASGCDRQEKRTDTPEAPEKKPTYQVIVPEEVQGEWRAVRIAVMDKETGKKATYTVDLGYSFGIPDSHLTVQAQHFLPALIVNGRVLTSASNETRNPAVQVVVRDNGKEIFTGWLFSLYPGSPEFNHPRYTLTLVDFIPAAKKS